MRRSLVLAASSSVAFLACAGAEVPPAPTCPTAVPVTVTTAAPTPTAPKHARSSDEVAKEIVASINDKNADHLFSLLDSDMRAVLPRPEAGALVEQVRDAKGAIVSTVREADAKSGAATYKLKAERGEWILELVLGTDGRVSGMTVTSPAPRDPEVAIATKPMGLPFRGQWFVVWGGGTPEGNRAHLLHKSQRRAADLVKVDDKGKTHSGDGKKNADYFAYGQDALATSDGTVITVIDGVPENDPGTMNPYFAYGNAVVIKHDENVYSTYAHLIPGKIRVKVGAKVKRGDLLGVTGNSGNSSEPHLHFQVQDGAPIDKSFGVEPRFEKVSVTTKGESARVRESYTWSKGDLVGEPQRR